MAKRSFGESSSSPSSSSSSAPKSTSVSVSQALKHADELLKAAQALKQDLEGLRGEQGPHDQALTILGRHNRVLLPATQALVQDEENISGRGEDRPHKSRKLNHSTTALNIPAPASLTRWTPADIPGSGLPPLPPVLDPILEAAALTHSGMVVHRTDMSYERLEWIGDAYLYLMASAFIYQTFPNLVAGRCSQLRERIIKNETLSDYTTKYGINQRTKFPAEFDLQGRVGGSQASQKAKKKVLGDVFESYVAAAILGDDAGLSRVAAWLKPLWGTALQEEIRNEFRNLPSISHQPGSANNGSSGNVQQDKNPKVLLVQAVGAKGVKISYIDVGEPKKDKNSKLPWYTVGVVFEGFGESDRILAHGSALSKKEAGAKAALRALENKKLIKELQKKRDDFQAAEASAMQAGDYDNWS